MSRPPGCSRPPFADRSTAEEFRFANQQPGKEPLLFEWTAGDQEIGTDVYFFVFSDRPKSTPAFLHFYPLAPQAQARNKYWRVFFGLQAPQTQTR